VPVSIDLRQISFGEPMFLMLLVLPALLLVAWMWRVVKRRTEIRRLAEHRTLPIAERYALVGDLPFWLCLVLASALLIVALARPHGPATAIRQGGIDLVILQDGSASMRVKDVGTDRWRRSIRFLRVIADALSWNNDRIALALFAHIAAPQIRLTKDPNTFFFFIDHLEQSSPFRIEDETTWDTNLELGIHWGLRLIERDEELHGKSPNAKMFLMVSDGESWSGEVEKSLKKAVDQGVPVFVVGVGTLGGGAMPPFKDDKGAVIVDPETPLTSRLDRPGLRRIAAVGGGQYFELDRDSDRRIANAIIDMGKRLAPVLGAVEQHEELYWRFVFAAALLPFLGLLFLRDRSELWLQALGSAVVLLIVSIILK